MTWSFFSQAIMCSVQSVFARELPVPFIRFGATPCDEFKGRLLSLPHWRESKQHEEDTVAIGMAHWQTLNRK